MISNGEGWHYLAVKKLLALLGGSTCKYLQVPRRIYSLNRLYSFFKSDKKLCENKYFCNVVMPSKCTKLLGFNQYRKSHKVPFIIYADHERLIEK